MKEVIGYDDNGYNVLGEKGKEKKQTKYRLIKVGDKYVIQKGFTFNEFTDNGTKRTTNYSDITDILDYETAIAKMNVLQGHYKVIEEFSA